MEEYVAKAQHIGLSEIGFSDHMLIHQSKSYQDFSPRSMHGYIRSFLKVRQTSELLVKLGIEMDFISGNSARVSEFIKQYPFDYVIGSVHFIGDWGIDHPSQAEVYLKRNILQVYEDYFDLVKQLCRTRLFNILAHPDLIKIFGFRPACDFSYLLVDVAEALAKADVCAEINPKGLIRPCKEIYPSEQFLRILYTHGVSVTFGSDAHEPNDLGKRLDEAVRLAKKVGYTHACIFDRQTKEFERI
jgi:histidinol-phosphatase (PHP family)